MFVKLTVLALALGLSAAAWNGPLAGGAPADRYPAGISPQACPNYPHCNNPAVAVHSAGGQQWGGQQQQWNAGHNNQWDQGNNGGGQWNDGNNGQWNGDNSNQWNNDHGNQWNNGGQNDWGQNNALDRGEYTGDGDYRGEGLAESGAYGGNGGHNNNGGGYDGSQGYAHQAPAGYAGHGGAAQVPAGVDPSSCPNYPFCH